MKARKRNKVSQVFRIRPELVDRLNRESKRSNVPKTRIVELSLDSHLKGKLP